MNKRVIKFINYLFIKHKINLYDKELIFNLLEEIMYDQLDFINNNIEQIMYYEIKDELFDIFYEILYVKYIESKLYKTIANYSEEEFLNLINNSINISISIIYKFVIPKREYGDSIVRKKNNKSINLTNQYNKINDTINNLKKIKQPEQRSDEWYIFRSSTLTASNIWKIFVSEYSQGQLVLEKCEPIDINKFKVTNLNSPLHWGQKYEPVSTMYYEFKNATVVTEFGCIPHSKYPFIAASPDGIVCDKNSDLFGRMLEIKNVVSREITGIPKFEYWVQMQIQMEVCDLNECDFLETKFVEYENYEDYLNDNTDKYKGIILLYFKEDNTPHYEYVPFNVVDFSSNEYKIWFENINNNNIKNNNIFDKFIYWRLDVISCILILRNKLWFNKIVPLIDNFWNNLLEEKHTEKYKDRIKKKRKLEREDNRVRNGFSQQGCLIDIDLNNKQILNEEKEPNNYVINVNTD